MTLSSSRDDGLRALPAFTVSDHFGGSLFARIIMPNGNAAAITLQVGSIAEQVCREFAEAYASQASRIAELEAENGRLRMWQSRAIALAIDCELAKAKP